MLAKLSSIWARPVLAFGPSSERFTTRLNFRCRSRWLAEYLESKTGLGRIQGPLVTNGSFKK